MRILKMMGLLVGLAFGGTTVTKEDRLFVKEMESIKVNLGLGSDLTIKETASVFRYIESNGRYDIGKSKNSSASGAYQIISKTRKMIISKKLKAYNGGYITNRNWLKPRNQDILFRWYLKHQRKLGRNVVKKNSVLTDYMRWNAGVTGGRRMINTILGKKIIVYTKGRFNIIRKNMVRRDIRKLRRYFMIKLKILAKKYKFKHNLKFFRVSGKYAKISDYRFMLGLNVKNKKRYRKLLNEGLRVNVLLWGKHFEQKVDYCLKRLR